MNTKLLAFCCFSLLCQTLSAQTFSVEYGSNDYAKTVGGVGYRLSIPTLHGVQLPAIRAVVVANPGVGGSTAFKVNERWVRWLHDNGLAYIGNDSPYSSGSLNALAAFAGDNLGGTTYPELLNVPVIVFGHSAGGSATTADAWNHPERCIAFVVEHTRVFLDVHDFANPAAAKSVPGYFRWGEWDHVRFWEGYQTGMGGDLVSTEVPTSAKVSIHAMIVQGAQWMTAYEHRQEHATQRHAIEEAMGFFGLMLPLRYDYQEGVTGKDPKLGPVNLIPISREDGWMGEHNFGAIQTRVTLDEHDQIDPGATHYSNFLMDWESADPHVAPFADFERQNKDEGHSWMADGDVAAFWATKFSHGHFDMQVEFLDLISDDLGTSATVNRNSLFPNAINTDQVVRVRVRPDGFPEAERVDFFRGATRVGTVTEEPYEFTYTFAPGDEGVHALYPVAVSAAGERRVGPRRMVQVVSNSRGANTAPTISPIGFVNGQAGQTLSIPFTVGDADGDSLTVVWREVNRAGVTSGSYTAGIGGSGANRTLDLTLPPNPGIIWGLVRVYDGDISTNAAVTIHVGGDGSAAPFFVGAEAIGLGGRGVGQNAIGAWSRKFSVRVYDYDTDPQDLILTATSSNQTAIPNENIRVGGAGSFRYVQVKPFGFATITLELSDGNTSLTESFSLTTRTADNTPPVISAIPDQTAFSSHLSDPVEVRVYDLHDETGQMTFSVVSSDPAMIPNESIQVTQVGERQHIRFTPSHGQTGTATLTATVTDTGGLSASSSFTVTVADPPEVQVSDAPLPAGMLAQPYQHALQAVGGVPPYTWSLTGGSLPAGLSLNSIGLLSGTPAEAGSFTFTVQVTDQEGDHATAELTLIVQGAPVITSHPQSITVLPGGNASFSVTAEGESVSYQWYEGVTPLDGETSANLLLENVQAERTVFVRVSNPAGSVDSDAATVSLSEVAPSLKINLGADLGAGWNSYADFGVFGTASTVTLNNLVFEDGTAADGVSLTLTRSNTQSAFCLAISDQTATAPASDWLTDAAAQSFWFINLNNGDPPHHLSFSVSGLPAGTYDLEAYVYVNSSYGSPANYYKFQGVATLAGLDGELAATDNPINSANYDALTTQAHILRWTNLQVMEGQSVDLRATVANNSKMPSLNAFSIRGKALASAGPEIVAPPASLTIQENESAALSVTATSSGGDLSYQWYEGPAGDTSAPVGGGQDVFTTPVLTRTTGYWVRVTDDNGFTDSTTAVVTVQRSGIPERILFIGNSFTNGYVDPMLSYNNSQVTDLNGGTHGGIPGIFAKLAAQGGYPVEVGIESVNGSTLFSRFPGKMGLITDPSWDRYVLQGRSQEAIPNDRGGMADGFPATVGNVAGAIRDANPDAGIHLYAFWASPKYLGETIDPASEHYYTNEEGLRKFQDEINAMYHQVNQQHGLDGWVAVGEAFQSALAGGLTPMWIADDHHASATGAYLSALMFYRDLLGGDPRLLDIGPGSAAAELGLTAFQALTAHEIAWAQTQPEPESPVIVEQVRIPMRDGAFLDAEIYRFGDSNFTPYPVTVISTIYNLDFHRHRYVDGTTDYGILADGQIYVGVHMRDAASGLEPFEFGSYASAYQATEDAYDIIEWISRQLWCNGRVGFKGGSGNGVGGSAAIWSNHPNLAAVSVVHTSSNFHDYWLFENGVKRDTFSLIGNRGINTTARLSIKPDTVRSDKSEWMDWTRRRALDFQGVYMESTGLYDIFQQAALDNFTALAETGRAHVILEPRWHGPAVTKYGGSGDLYSIYAGRPGFSVNYNDLMNGAAPAGTSQFHYAVLSPSSNLYRSSDRFPLPHTPVPFYLRADGGLAHTPPAGAEQGTVTYSYDPNNPAPNVGGKAFSSDTNYGPLDQSGISGRPDIVVFESPVFTEAMEFTGEVEVDLYFSTDVEDTQFVVKLVDVNPDSGFEALLRQGVCMARYQAGFGEDPATLPRLQPGVVYHLNFKLWAASHILEPGHKLAVHITSAAADISETDARKHYYEIHPNSIDPVANLENAAVANQVIHATADYPSRVVLPVTQWQGPGPQLRVTRDGLNLTLENLNLTHDLSLSSIILEGEDAADFSVPAFPATLTAGASETLTLGFTATAPGLSRATVVIQSDDPFVPETRVPVEAGRGLLVRGGEWIPSGDLNPTWQKHSDFLELRRGRSRDRVFILHNFSSGSVEISGVSLSGDPAFSVAQSPAASLTAGQTATLVLRYAPIAGGVHTATVTVQSDDVDFPSYSFAIRGECTDHGPIHDPLLAPEDLSIPAGAQTLWTLEPSDLFHSPDAAPMDILVTLEDGSPLPAWLNWDGGTFTANPAGSDAGIHSIRVRARETTAPELYEDVIFSVEVTADLPPLEIIGQPQSVSIAGGSTTTLSVTVVGGSGSYTYQWYQGQSGDSSTPVGINSSGFTTPALSESTAYWVSVSDGISTLNSNTATITVSVSPPPGDGPLYYEGFDYGSGINLNGADGGNGWGGPWDKGGGIAGDVLEQGLEFSAGEIELTVQGRSAINANSFVYYVRPLSRTYSSSDDRTLWFSFLGYMVGDTARVIEFTDASGGQNRLSIGTHSSAAGKWQAGNQRYSGGTSTGIDHATTAGNPDFILARLQLNASGDDVFDVWVNPSLGGEPTGEGDARRTGNWTFDRLRFISHTTNSLGIDEIRIGNTWVDVVPSTGSGVEWGPETTRLYLDINGTEEEHGVTSGEPVVWNLENAIWSPELYTGQGLNLDHDFTAPTVPWLDGARVALTGGHPMSPPVTLQLAQDISLRELGFYDIGDYRFDTHGDGPVTLTLLENPVLDPGEYATLFVSGKVDLQGDFRFLESRGGRVVLEAADAPRPVAGTVTFFQGQLIAGANRTGEATRLHFAAGAHSSSFDLNAETVLIGLLSGEGDAGTDWIEPAADGPALSTLVVRQHENSAFSGDLRDRMEGNVLALRKEGTGTLTLTGMLSHSGGTVIQGGTLHAPGRSLGSGNVTVQEGGTLRISAGAASQVQANLQLENGASLQADLLAGASAATVQGNLILGDEVILNVSSGGNAPEDGTYPLMTVQGNVEGAFSSVVVEGGKYGTLGVDGNTLLISVSTDPPLTYDSWISGHGLSGSDADDLADPDNDGIINLLEYAFALNPLLPIQTREGLPFGHVLAEEGLLYHALVFRRNRMATDLTYHIEASLDLADWQTVELDPSDVTVLDEDVDGDGQAELVQVRVDVSASTLHFLRVRVTRW